MTRDEYRGYAERVNNGQVVVVDGRSAANIEQLNWIARLGDEPVAEDELISVETPEDVPTATGPTVADLQNDLATVTSERDLLAESVSKAGTENQDLKARLANLEKSEEQLRAEIAKVAHDRDALTLAKAELAEENAELKARLAGLEKAPEEKSAEEKPARK